jgi:hypothetical protein
MEQVFWQWTYWTEASYDKVYDHIVDTDGTVQCLGKNPGKVEAALARDPRRLHIQRQMDTFMAVYMRGVLDTTPEPTALEKWYHAKFAEGHSRSEFMSFDEAKRKIKDQAGIDTLQNPEGTASAVNFLLAPVIGRDGGFFVSQDGKLHPNYGMAWDQFLQPYKTEAEREGRGQGSIPLDKATVDGTPLIDLMPAKDENGPEPDNPDQDRLLEYLKLAEAEGYPVREELERLSLNEPITSYCERKGLERKRFHALHAWLKYHLRKK